MKSRVEVRPSERPVVEQLGIDLAGFSPRRHRDTEKSQNMLSREHTRMKANRETNAGFSFEEKLGSKFEMKFEKIYEEQSRGAAKAKNPVIEQLGSDLSGFVPFSRQSPYLLSAPG